MRTANNARVPSSRMKRSQRAVRDSIFVSVLSLTIVLRGGQYDMLRR